MEDNIKILNKLIIEIFNDVLEIEEKAMNEGAFKDISIKEVHTIDAIGMYEPRMMSEVAADLRVTVGTLTVSINNLVKKGYVERMRIKEDRRVVMVKLTRSGRLVYRIHSMFHKNLVKNAVEGLDDQGEKILVNSLMKINEFLKSSQDFHGSKKHEAGEKHND